jgi:hypothetical protein
VLGLVREKYGGPVGECFGPTLAAEHLAAGSGLMRRRCGAGCWKRGCGVGSDGGGDIGTGAWKPHFGEMVQTDGRFHLWLEERGPVPQDAR